MEDGNISFFLDTEKHIYVLLFYHMNIDVDQMGFENTYFEQP